MQEKRIIPITVSGEYIKGAGVPVGAAGSHNDVVLEMSFGSFWQGLVKSITWYDANGDNPVITLLTTNLLKEGTTTVYLVPIPIEAKAYAGKLTMTVKGAYIESELETRASVTTTAKFIVLPSDYSEDAARVGVTPTQAEQLQAQIENIIGDISDARTAAGQAIAASESANVSKNMAMMAADAAVTAGEAADRAAESAEADRESAEAAMDSAVRAMEAFERLTIDVCTLDAGANATVERTTVDGAEKLTLGIPKGEVGETGPRGPTGFAVASDGHYFFTQDENGHLLLHYTGNTPPNFHIGNDGHLYLSVTDGDGALDIGNVKGEKGDAFLYSDFTAEQLADLKGATGDTGYTPQKGIDYYTPSEVEEWITLIENAEAAVQNAAEAREAALAAANEISIENEDNGKNYTYKFFVRDGHFGIRTEEITGGNE